MIRVLICLLLVSTCLHAGNTVTIFNNSGSQAITGGGGGGAYGANSSLSNLSSPTSINASLEPAAANTYDMGSTKAWRSSSITTGIFQTVGLNNSSLLRWNTARTTVEWSTNAGANYNLLGKGTVVAAFYTSSTQNIIQNQWVTGRMANKVYDDNNMYSPSTGQFTVPYSGYYDLSFALSAVATNSTVNTRVLDTYIYINGTRNQGIQGFVLPVTSTNYNATSNGSYKMKLNANDVVELRIGMTAGGSTPLQDNGQTWISITRLGE